MPVPAAPVCKLFITHFTYKYFIFPFIFTQYCPCMSVSIGPAIKSFTTY